MSTSDDIIKGKIMKHEETIKKLIEIGNSKGVPRWEFNKDNTIVQVYDLKMTGFYDVQYVTKEYSHIVTFKIHINELLFDKYLMEKVFGNKPEYCNACERVHTYSADCDAAGIGYDNVPNYLWIMEKLLPLSNQERLDYIAKELEKLN